LTIISALVRRWILLIRFALARTRANGSERGEDSVQADFVECVVGLGAEYDYTMRHEENSEFSVRCADLQFRFLMSSDLYERPGLMSTFFHLILLTSDPLVESIIDILHRPGNVQSNGIVDGEKDSSNRLEPVRNVLAIISRIPLEPIPRSLRDSVFMELISLDRALIYGLIPQITDNEITSQVLATTRRSLFRLIDTVSKDVIMVLGNAS
jgi:hypothetical protein